MGGQVKEPATEMRPSFPTSDEWAALTSDERRHMALILLLDAVENEHGHGPLDRRSLRVRNAVRLGHMAMWRDGFNPMGE